MRPALELCPGQQCRVIQRRVIQSIRKHGVIASYQGCHDADVSHITCREQQRTRQPDELCKRMFKRMMSGHMSRDQMRSARADAKPCGALRRCGYKARIRRESKIIIAAECDYLAAV